MQNAVVLNVTLLERDYKDDGDQARKSSHRNLAAFIEEFSGRLRLTRCIASGVMPIFRQNDN